MVSKEPQAPSEVPMCEAPILLSLLIHERLRIEILRTSPFGHSRKFASRAQKATWMHRPSPAIGKQFLRVVLRGVGIDCMVRS
jgi:hypothetical protein